MVKTHSSTLRNESRRKRIRMVTTSCPGGGLQSHAQSHGPVFARIAQPASYGRPQLYTYGRPPTPVRQVVLNPALTPFQCGICQIFYTSEVDLLERHIDDTHRRSNRSTTTYAPTHVTQAQRQSVYAPPVPPLQLMPHGTAQPTYQHQWMPMMRYNVVRSSTGVTSAPTFTHSMQASQVCPGGVSSLTNRIAAQTPPIAQTQGSTMAVMASVPSTASEWFSTLQSFPGTRSAYGAARDSKEGPSCKRRRSFPDVRQSVDFSSSSSAKAGSQEARGEVCEAAEQQAEVMIFESEDLQQEFAPAAVTLTYKNSLSIQRQQQQQMEQTASSTSAVATSVSLDAAAHHSPGTAELGDTVSHRSDDARETGKCHTKVSISHYLSAEELPCESLAGDSCVSNTERASSVNKETVSPHHNAAMPQHERIKVTGTTEVAAGCVLTVVSENNDENARSLRGSEFSSEIRQLGSDTAQATLAGVSTSQTSADAESTSKAMQMDKQKHEVQLKQKTLEGDSGESKSRLNDSMNKTTDDLATAIN
ncbi:hypothetical protein BIW11_00510 [Tropilaelaps mercedesae]|uniref:Uncharacterized protein n=1 Tax=Tropilaelaps mercedesae TaxID=418985 RepID=A0A1V9XU64_9ACAR|nr:hypothetical protein BIW11_00510 [Tropilaelaps mercedesae]